MTAAVPSGRRFARLILLRTQAAGSMKTAAASLIVSGTLCAAWAVARSWISTWSANPPGSIRLSRKVSHMVSFPRRQRWHEPQGTWWGTTTRSPMANWLMPAPRVTTSPTISWPRTIPGFALLVVSLKRSVPQNPTHLSFKSSSPVPGSGMGRDSIVVSSPPRHAMTLLIGNTAALRPETIAHI